MMLIPKRKGQKIKSKVLLHFNNRLPFQTVEIWNTSFTEKEYGIIDSEKSTDDKIYVWRNNDLISEHVNHTHLRVVEVPFPPRKAFDQFDATIGGIGKHLRWKVVLSKKKHKGECKIFVSDIVDTNTFENFVKHKIIPFGFCNFEYVKVAENITCLVNIPNYKDLTFVSAAFHCAGYSAIPMSDEMASYGNIGIERYDRSEHTWWNQNQKDAGPLRDTHKWKYGFIPDTWKTLPFTWQSMASNIEIHENDIANIPLPLRNYVCEYNNVKENSTKWTKYQTEKPCVTSRLTYDQNIQLLKVTYWTFVAPFDNLIIHLSSLIQFRFMLHGYLGREMGGYRQLAKYIGHGAYCRKFKNKPQYNYDNLQIELRSKFVQSDGEMRGNGFKGTRGKYGDINFPQYQPAKKMKRTIEAELNIRDKPVNKFQEYMAQA